MPQHANAQNDIYKSCSKPNIKVNSYILAACIGSLYLRAEAALVWEGFAVRSWYKLGIEMSFQENGVTDPVDDYMNSNLHLGIVFSIIVWETLLLRVRLLSSLKTNRAEVGKNYDSEVDCFVS